MKKSIRYFGAAAVVFAATAAQNVYSQSTVFGEGRTPVGAGDAVSIRNSAKQEAIRDAVVKAIKDATALDASDSRFSETINEVAKQLRDVKVKDETREGADFVTRIEAYVDRRQIKNAIRGTDLDKLNDRSFSILMLVDEFLTNSRDLNLPLREVTEFSYDSGSSFKDKTRAASASTSSSSAAFSGASNVSASRASQGQVSGRSSEGASVQTREGSAAAAAASSYSAQGSSAATYKSSDSVSAASSSKSSKASAYQANVEANSHEKASYKKLIEYQDTSKPSSNSVFLSSFGGHLRDYDLRLLDSSIIRSKFFGDKKITLATLGNSADMAKFAEFARKSKADFLMVGSSTVIAGEINPATGLQSCAVTAEVKVFATAGSEQISSAAESTEAAGRNIEDCAAKASTKIANMLAPEFANRTLGYWADRAARGRQYSIEFRGSSLPLPLRMAVAKALREIPDASDVETKENTDSLYSATVTIKGKQNPFELVFGAVSSQSAFSSKTLDGAEEGELLVLCLNSCKVPASVEPAAQGNKPVAKQKK